MKFTISRFEKKGFGNASTGAAVAKAWYEKWNGFGAKMSWFSSQYRPIQFQIKFIKLFERAPKCNVFGNPNDIKLDQQYRMGN
jgi:hypothetical protein